MQRWQRLIYFHQCLKKNYCFQLWVLYKSDLRISIAVKNRNYQKQSLLNLEKRYYLPQYKGFKGTDVNQALPSFHGGSLKHFSYSPFKGKPGVNNNFRFKQTYFPEIHGNILIGT